MKKPPLPAQAERALREAAAALRARRPADAASLAAGVLEAIPGQSAAARLLGQALLMLGRPIEAIETLSRVADLESDPTTQTLLARGLAAAGRSDEAVARLRAATAHPAPFAPALLELADLLGRLGRVEEAVAALAQAINQLPEDPLPRMALGYLHLRRDDRAAAREAFAWVRAAAPERHDAMVALATVVGLDGEAAVAADLYRQALGARPHDGVTRINLAACLLETGDRTEGEEMLRLATAEDPALAGRAMTVLAASPHGRFFLKPSAAAGFLTPATI